MGKINLEFEIEETTISVNEISMYLASHVFVGWVSESQMELLSKDMSKAIMTCVAEKVITMRDSKKQDRAQWIHDHPPNHAGYYYCHLCGGWVHVNEMELDHITPKSILGMGDPNRDDNRRPSHIWPIWNDGKEVCPGNRGKGSQQIPSVTLEIAPPDDPA